MFDADDIPAPFEFHKLEPVSVTPEPAALPFFSWSNAKPAGVLPRKTDVEINSDGAVIRIHATGASGQEQTGTPAAAVRYLLDLSEYKGKAAPVSLRLEMGGEGQFHVPVHLRYSGDLSSWETFGVQDSVIGRFGENQIVRDSIYGKCTGALTFFPDPALDSADCGGTASDALCLPHARKMKG
jgi:hypothetical protein